MRTNTDCTLYHRDTDPETHGEIWRRMELRGVMWQDERQVNVTGGGLQSADSTAVYIPLATRETWTLRDGDLLVQGIVPDIVPPAAARVILSVAHNTFGSSALHHWEVHLK